VNGDLGGLLELLGRPLLVGGLLIAMALAVAALALASLVRRDRAAHGPSARRLCRALGLSKTEARLLGRVARASRAPGAGSLLVSRGCFDDAVGSYAAGAESARRLEVIRRKVFE
jgi:hypothetical protein